MMLSEILRSSITAGYIAGAVMTAAEHWKLEGWRRWVFACGLVVALWISVRTLGLVAASYGL